MSRVTFKTPHCEGAITGLQEWLGDGVIIVGAQRIPLIWVTAVPTVPLKLRNGR